MTPRNIFAYTPAEPMPPYISVNEGPRRGSLEVTVRSPAADGTLGPTALIGLERGHVVMLAAALNAFLNAHGAA